MHAVASPALRRLGAGLVVFAYLASSVAPCRAAPGLSDPSAGGHAAHATHAQHQHPADSDALVLQVPCDCGCQRAPGTSGLLSSPGPALLPAPWRLVTPCLKTSVGPVHVRALAEPNVAIDHVPIFHLL